MTGTDLGDPSGIGAVASAVGWIERLLTGSLATAIAVVAVASVGFLMLTGHVDVRRGAQVILGCFVIFGASSIASGLYTAANRARSAPRVPVVNVAPTPSAPPVAPVYPESPPQPYDPYAGAALPS